jgi:hypothetical protein
MFDQKKGNDKYAFMEKMVTDPTVTHVLVMCDISYAEKADARKVGVGTETQIISREIYEKVEQSKFIPIVCEFSEPGEPFSSDIAQNTNLDRFFFARKDE